MTEENQNLLPQEDPSSKIKEVIEEQRKKIANIESDLNSNFINIQLEGISMIPNVIDPIVRHRLEEFSYKIIMQIFEDLDLTSPTSIANTLKTMGYVNYLSGNLKNQALRKASEIYYFLEKKRPLDTEIVHNPFLRELTVNDNSERIALANDITPHTEKSPALDALDAESESTQTSSLQENKENYQLFSNKEKIGWVLNLLRSESWPEIKIGIKLFYSLGKIDEKEVPKILIESAERKIIELITFGLNCKETNLPSTPLQKNSVYANLMAIDLIGYVPKDLQIKLIEIAEQNEELGDLAKEKLKKMKV